MRPIAILAVFATACTGLPSSGPHHDSVIERLSDVPTSLYVHDDASSGALTARRLGATGWIAGTTTLAIEHGYVRTGLDADGQLAIEQLDIAIAPIAVTGVFEKDARLEDVRVHLAEPARGDVVWTSADDATATAQMAFDLDWTLAFEGDDPYPLATQHLNTVTAAIVIGGQGDHVAVRIDIESAGELWNWADLIQFSSLSLSLDAETTD